MIAAELARIRNSSPWRVRRPDARGIFSSTLAIAGRTSTIPSPGSSVRTSGSRGRGVIGESMARPPRRSLKLRVSNTSISRSGWKPISDVDMLPLWPSHTPTVSVRSPPVAVGIRTSAVRSRPPLRLTSATSPTSTDGAERAVLEDLAVPPRVDRERMGPAERRHDGPARGVATRLRSASALMVTRAPSIARCSTFIIVQSSPPSPSWKAGCANLV